MHSHPTPSSAKVNCLRTLLHVFRLAAAVARRPRIWLLRQCFESHGPNFSFDPDGHYTFHNISVGSNVFLGVGATLIAGKSKIRIGSNVMFGPHVCLFGGGHNTAVVGKFMVDVTEKRPSDDLGVVIEDDVWLGSRAMILRGVVIRRGSIIGAGSVVTKTVLPYTVVAGCPAGLIGQRFSLDQAVSHERTLYAIHERLTPQELSHLEVGG